VTRPERAHTTQGLPFAQTRADPGVIDFGLGQPSPSLLPIAELGAAAAAALGPGADPLLLQYGAMRGYEGIREALARFSSAEYGEPVHAEQLMVTAGTSATLALASQVFAEPGAIVICEDPTYFLAQGVFAHHDLEIVGLPCDALGLDIDHLEQWLRASARAPAFVYCIPNFHNPCAVSLSPDRAARLVELAQRHDFLILADEPYTILHHVESGAESASDLGAAQARPPCLMHYDHGRGRVLSLGSFSKILGPGLRLGWVHAERRLVDRLCGHGSIRSGGGLNPVVSAIVHGTLDSGFLTRHVAHLRRTFASRAAVMTAALRQHLPQGSFEAPRGGYFTWVELPPGVDTSALLEPLRALGVGFTPGQRCAVDRDLRRYLRLCFAFYDEGEIELGVERLARGLEQVG